MTAVTWSWSKGGCAVDDTVHLANKTHRFSCLKGDTPKKQWWSVSSISLPLPPLPFFPFWPPFYHFCSFHFLHATQLAGWELQIWHCQVVCDHRHEVGRAEEKGAIKLGPLNLRTSSLDAAVKWELNPDHDLCSHMKGLSFLRAIRTHFKLMRGSRSKEKTDDWEEREERRRNLFTVSVGPWGGFMGQHSSSPSHWRRYGKDANRLVKWLEWTYHLPISDFFMGEKNEML